jgi:hypothetical protein
MEDVIETVNNPVESSLMLVTFKPPESRDAVA